jgi:hypothetical protein
VQVSTDKDFKRVLTGVVAHESRAPHADFHVVRVTGPLEHGITRKGESDGVHNGHDISVFICTQTGSCLDTPRVMLPFLANTPSRTSGFGSVSGCGASASERCVCESSKKRAARSSASALGACLRVFIWVMFYRRVLFPLVSALRVRRQSSADSSDETNPPHQSSSTNLL